MVLGFDGDLEFDPALFEVRRAGAVVPLEPQAFDVLSYLVAHRDRVVPKEELMDGVWGGRFVSETAVTSRIKQVRRALGDDGQAQRMIRTVHGRGYRFVAPIEARASAPIRYTVSDGLHIAYQVTGGGDLDIVLVPGFVSHLELDWADPRHAHFLDRLGSFGRLIRFDKRGTGMSDRPAGPRDADARRARRDGRGRVPRGRPGRLLRGRADGDPVRRGTPRAGHVAGPVRQLRQADPVRRPPLGADAGGPCGVHRAARQPL